MRAKFFLCILLLVGVPAFALTVDEPLKDPAQESRAKALFQEIRCAVCQSESIADSPAEVARDMRKNIREHISAGESNEAIKATLTSRYGDFILMQPPLKPATWLLWFGPLMILLGAGWFIARFFKRQKAS